MAGEGGRDLTFCRWQPEGELGGNSRVSFKGLSLSSLMATLLFSSPKYKFLLFRLPGGTQVVPPESNGPRGSGLGRAEAWRMTFFFFFFWVILEQGLGDANCILETKDMYVSLSLQSERRGAEEKASVIPFFTRRCDRRTKAQGHLPR